MDDVVFLDSGQSLIKPKRTVGQFFVIQTEEVKKGGVEIIHMNRAVGNPVTQVIRAAMNVTGFDSTSCHPNRESFFVMVATASLSHGGTTEFSAPDNECLVKQPSFLEVLDQGADRLINLLALVGQTAV